jgi:protocatechuate 3,4-dioxygenase beta subunit
MWFFPAIHSDKTDLGSPTDALPNSGDISPVLTRLFGAVATIQQVSEQRHGLGLSRREAIAGVAAAGVGAGLYVLLRGGPDNAVSAPSCVLAPEQTEGPYYVDDHLIRRDIRAGKSGMPLSLRLQVLDASSCKPIHGATVEVWHCDALGRYSGFNAPGNFLRGGQRTNSSGWVTFRTIYPGWYQGRTTHIHVKVHVGGSVVHTGQLYFADATTASVYRSRSPYRSRGQKDRSNAQDMVFADGGRQSMLRLTRSGAGFVGRLALGVRA